MSRTLRKYVSSALKRYYQLVSNGYSIGHAYGLRFLFDWNHSLDKKVALQLYENEQLLFTADLVTQLKPQRFYDIGAHAGLYSLLVLKNSPQTEVHAFEPDRQNLSQLYANLYLNQNYDQVTVHNLAVSNTTGTAYLDRSERTGRGTRTLASDGNYPVEVQRFDDLFSDTDTLSFFKIDVEGHECSVIQGAEKYLAANPCVLLIESMADKRDALQAMMAKLGYRQAPVPAGVGDSVFLNCEAPLM